MTTKKDTIFEKFLAPIFDNFLLDRQAMQNLGNSVDWEKEAERFRQPNFIYPDYYQSQNFHGVERGYLNPSAAISYDPITQYVLPPGENLVRQGLINQIKVKPRRILDLGCGTGSLTLMLKETFPQAEVIGLDLSPYMLVMAEMKATKAKLNIQWRHGDAAATKLPDESYDLITAALLFHETPPPIINNILRESFRLLKVGGQMLILDGNQKSLRHTQWLTEIFEEPYIKSYADGSVDAWLGAAGFGAVKTEEFWWIHQISQGVKPIASHTIDPISLDVHREEADRSILEPELTPIPT